MNTYDTHDDNSDVYGGRNSMAAIRPSLIERKHKQPGHVRSAVRSDELESLLSQVVVENPEEPTDYPPGSIGKMAVMRARNELAMDSLHVVGDRIEHGKQVA